MKKLLFFFYLVLLTPILCSAQIKALQVNENNGTSVIFPLVENPVISCKNGELNIISSKTTYNIGLSQINNYKIIDYTNSLDEIFVDNPNFILKDKVIFIYNLNANNQIFIYDLKGNLVTSYPVTSNSITLDLSSLSTGIYILYTHSANYKIKL